MDDKRPDRTTMEGMIWNANHVLDQALGPETEGIPRGMVQNCQGIILLSVVEAGFIFSGHVGTGIIVANNDDGSWSPPSAIALGGIGCGLVIGAEVKDIVMCITRWEESTLEALAGDHQFKFGGQVSATIGPIGREAEVSFHLSEKGYGQTFTYTFTRGVFAGLSLESAILSVRSKENKRFYGKAANSKEILLENAVECPKGKGIEELHRKLDLLRKGKVSIPTPSELEKKDSMRIEAEAAGVAAKPDQSDVVQVEANAESSATAMLNGLEKIDNKAEGTSEERASGPVDVDTVLDDEAEKKSEEEAMSGPVDVDTVEASVVAEKANEAVEEKMEPEEDGVKKLDPDGKDEDNKKMDPESEKMDPDGEEVPELTRGDVESNDDSAVAKAENDANVTATDPDGEVTKPENAGEAGEARVGASDSQAEEAKEVGDKLEP
eukprot:CAMPEP_0183702776 /NCGR_PEP_ID=MMETSP0737-20130205/773_1 /TAXON_ID=385413 /ORGANISM="Thalassiosira miniscula, Strain CCMP1093" /LENGTH=436 /DNA_ID=CAMNT_0025929451 /DNA_START=90 /DNA_END=1400 /DNA_ORIENTATION=+